MAPIDPPPTPTADSRPYFRWFLQEYCPRHGLKPRTQDEATELLLSELARHALAASASRDTTKQRLTALPTWSDTPEGVPA